MTIDILYFLWPPLQTGLWISRFYFLFARSQWSTYLRKKLTDIKHKELQFLMFIKINMLQFLLIKCFTVSMCELFGRVKVVRDITMDTNLFVYFTTSHRTLHCSASCTENCRFCCWSKCLPFWSLYWPSSDTCLTSRWQHALRLTLSTIILQVKITPYLMPWITL